MALHDNDPTRFPRLTSIAIVLCSLLGCTSYQAAAPRKDGKVYLVYTTGFLIFYDSRVALCDSHHQQLDCQDLAIHSGRSTASKSSQQTQEFTGSGRAITGQHGSAPAPVSTPRHRSRAPRAVPDSPRQVERTLAVESHADLDRLFQALLEWQGRHLRLQMTSGAAYEGVLLPFDGEAVRLNTKSGQQSYRIEAIRQVSVLKDGSIR
jgi:hypothetical protein